MRHLLRYFRPKVPSGTFGMMGRLRAAAAAGIIAGFVCSGPAHAEGAPINVVFVGDSMSDGVGAAVQRFVSRDACLAQRVRISRHAEIGTGLARADRFHWPEKVRTIVTETGADLVVASFGLNDRTGVVDTASNVRVAFGSPEWQARYTDQVLAFLRGAATATAGALWLGIPSLRDQTAHEDGIAKNALYRSAIAAFGNSKVAFVEPWSAGADKADTFQSYWTDQNGAKIQIRAPDGIHFTGTGYDLIALYLSPRILAHLESQFGSSRLHCEG